jgi:hypothetical protein
MRIGKVCDGDIEDVPVGALSVVLGRAVEETL